MNTIVGIVIALVVGLFVLLPLLSIIAKGNGDGL